MMKIIFLHEEQIKNFVKLSSELNLFTNPSARAGYNTRSIFKQSLTGLNSEFPSPRLVA